MRQKKIKAATLENLDKLNVITTAAPIDFKFDQINLEIGSGKGQFITNLALNNPLVGYVALEKDLNVCYRLAQKQELLKLNNLIIICGDAKDLLEYFSPNSLNMIYLNFSDPWPKVRHHKRRLTFKSFLMIYQKLLKPSGIIQVRSDHQNFFDDSLEYLAEYFSMINVDYNLEPSLFMTEYEVKKRLFGPIYQYQGVVIK